MLSIIYFIYFLYPDKSILDGKFVPDSVKITRETPKVWLRRSVIAATVPCARDFCSGNTAHSHFQMKSGYNGGLIASRETPAGALAVAALGLERQGSLYKGSCPEMPNTGVYSSAQVPPPTSRSK